MGQVLDERSGEVLEPDKVKKARGRELEKMETHGVEKDIRLSEAKSRGLKIIRSRWVFVKKALPEDPQGVRSRCVAQEINMGPRDDVFAGTPPLWVHRMVISLAGTHRKRERRGQRLIARYDVSMLSSMPCQAEESQSSLPKISLTENGLGNWSRL